MKNHKYLAGKMVKVKANPPRGNRWQDWVEREEIYVTEFDVKGLSARLLTVDVRDWKPEEVFYVGRTFQDGPRYGAGGSAYRAGSKLNNPFSLWSKHIGIAGGIDESKRERSIELYSMWLKKYVMLPGINGTEFTAGEIKDPKFYPFKFTAADCILAWNELHRLATILRSGRTMRLACWCKRKGTATACHGDIIAQAIKYLIENGYV